MMPNTAIYFFASFSAFVLVMGAWAEWIIAQSPAPEVERRMNLNNALRLIGVTHRLPAHIFESFRDYLSSYGPEHGWTWTKQEVYRVWSEFAGLHREELKKWQEFQRRELEHAKQISERERDVLNGTLRAGEPYRVFDPKNKTAEL